MNRADMDTYIVTVYDPEKHIESHYPYIRAVSAEHAERQAKDNYTGIVGDWEQIQKRLEVKVVMCPK